jgi:sigma-E factor negative regulatory protein RseA
MTMNNVSSLPLELQLSAFVDGELAPEALAQLLADLSHQDKLREDWHAYHVVGDILRSAALAPSAADAAFLSRLEERLVNEPTRPVQTTPVHVAPFGHGTATNQRWAWLVGAALSVVLVAVSVSVWQRDLAPAGAELAASAPAAMVAATASDANDVMIRDPHLDALMQAHQQLGGHSAWQMPSGFLRNATYAEPPR